jgi:predicted metal-dependent peptidase
MFETYRMLGREHEADLAREAAKVARAAGARAPSTSRRRLSRTVALNADLPWPTWLLRGAGSLRRERRRTA